LLFLSYIVAFIDRSNSGFAALTMLRISRLRAPNSGCLTGIFLWGYFLFEIPSNLIHAQDRGPHLGHTHPG
jgi:ACS family tartrate transporter-like MFS transporter